MKSLADLRPEAAVYTGSIADCACTDQAGDNPAMPTTRSGDGTKNRNRATAIALPMTGPADSRSRLQMPAMTSTTGMCSYRAALPGGIRRFWAVEPASGTQSGHGDFAGTPIIGVIIVLPGSGMSRHPQSRGRAARVELARGGPPVRVYVTGLAGERATCCRCRRLAQSLRRV